MTEEYQAMNMSNELPLISVIVTAHDRTNYIANALNSLVSQNLSRDKFEVLVVKNFQIPEIEEKIEKSGYTPIPSPKDSTIGWDLYTGIVQSKGKILCFLDDDDIYKPNRLEIILDQFNSYDISYLKNEVYFIDDSGLTIQKPHRLEITRSKVIKSKDFRRNISYLNRVKADFNMSSICVSRKLLTDELLSFLKNRLSIAPDTFMLCAALSDHYPIMILKERITGYRLNNSTTKVTQINRDSAEIIIKAWNRLVNSYKQFLLIFGSTPQIYLNQRILFQKVSESILSLKYDKALDEKVSLIQLLTFSMRTFNYLLLYDTLRLFLARIFLRSRNT